MQEPTMPTPSGIRFVRNVLWNFGGQAWSLALAFFTTPYIVRRLGADSYGLLMTAGVVTSYLWFMDLGLGGASVKYIAEHAAREEWDEVRRIFWSSWIAYLALGTLAAGVIVLITPLCVYRWFRIPPELQGPAISVFHLSALGFLIGMLTNAPAAIPRAFQRFDIVNRIGILVGTTQTLLAVLLLAFGYSVREVVAGNLVVATLALAINTRVARSLLPRWGRPRCDVSVLRRLLRFGGWVTVSSVAGPILVQLEKILLAHQASTAAVAYYMVPYNLTARFWVISGAFSSALFPLFSSLSGLGRKEEAIDINLRVTRLVMLLLLPFVVFFVVFGRDFLRFWMGPDFAEESTGALRVLALAMFINAAAWSPYTMLQGFGRPDLTAKFHILELFIHVPVALLFVRSLGVTGAAWAWFVRVTLDTGLIYGAVMYLHSLDRRRWFRTVWGRPVVVTAFGGFVAGILRVFFPDHWSPLWTLVVFGGAPFIIAGLSIWRWGIDRGEYHVLARAIRWRQGG